MENQNLDTKKLKAMFRDPVVKTVIVSFLTIIITLGLIFGTAWYYRSKIFRLLAGEYNANVKSATSNLVYNPESKLDTISSTAEIPVAVQQAEDTVVGAVKRAKPAVVSIVISKEVPKYDVSYDQNNSTDPFGGMFPGVFFQTPVYKQNGTEKKQIGGGSGFLISSDGMIVTNRHVVEDKDAIYEVLLNNGKKYTAKVLARDGVLDVAYLF